MTLKHALRPKLPQSPYENLKVDMQSSVTNSFNKEIQDRKKLTPLKQHSNSKTLFVPNNTTTSSVKADDTSLLNPK